MESSDYRELIQKYMNMAMRSPNQEVYESEEESDSEPEDPRPRLIRSSWDVDVYESDEPPRRGSFLEYYEKQLKKDRIRR